MSINVFLKSLNKMLGDNSLLLILGAFGLGFVASKYIPGLYGNMFPPPQIPIQEIQQQPQIPQPQQQQQPSQGMEYSSPQSVNIANNDDLPLYDEMINSGMSDDDIKIVNDIKPSNKY